MSLGPPKGGVCICCGTAYLDAEANFCHICGDPRIPAAPPEQSALSSDVKRFARRAAEHLSEEGCMIVVFEPWGEAGGPPPGICAPEVGGEGATLDLDDASQPLNGKQIILAPCTFKTKCEEAAANSIVNQLVDYPEVYVFLVFVLEANRDPELEEVNDIMDRYAAMFATGADDVLMNPDLEPHSLRRAIEFARATLAAHVERLKAISDEIGPNELLELSKLEGRHQRLLWDDVVGGTMARIPKADPYLKEDEQFIGEYHIEGTFQTVSGSIVCVCERNGVESVVKIIDKSQLFTAKDIETIYREVKILSEIVEHPNIARCTEILHSKSQLYLVLQCAGRANLAQRLSNQPGQRFDADVALDIFRQLAEALAHCHNKDIAHRSVSLEHVVLRPASPDRYFCSVVDFRMAILARNGVKSNIVCGRFPCLAPEVIIESPYVPKFLDIWSTGVVLLEIAGGLSTLSRSVSFDPMAGSTHSVASKIHDFFSSHGSHAAALAYVGNVRDSDIISVLEMLLVPTPSKRSGMCQCLSSLHFVSSDNAVLVVSHDA